MLSCFLTAFYQLALFIFYFFYFLFKGKPEWQKIGYDVRCTTSNCCLHNPKVQTEISSSGSPTPAKNVQPIDGSDSVKTEISWRTDKKTTTTTSLLQKFQGPSSCRHLYEQYADRAAQTFQRLCTVLYGILVRTVTLVPNLIIWLYWIIYNWLMNRGTVTTGDISKQQFIQKAIAKTAAEEAAAEQNQQQQETSNADTFTESHLDAEVTFQKRSPVEQPSIEQAEFYSRIQSYPRDFEKPIPEELSTAPSQAAPPPPPSLPTTFPAVTTTIIKDEKTVEKVPPKGGIAVLPPDLMAEAHARVKEREQKLSEQEADVSQENVENMSTDWTVTSKRFIPTEWAAPISKMETATEVESKASEDESEIWRPTSRNVVSRIPRSSDEDAQFIFRAPKHQTVSPNWLPEGSFLMGRSVFSPVREAEEMRNRVNRRLTETPSESRFGSRLHTPLEDSNVTSRMNTPFDAATYDSHADRYTSYPASRSRSQSRIHTVFSPVTVNQTFSPRANEHRIGMIRQRSRTAEPRAESTVKALTRQWPPQSNATGAQLVKDNWNIVPSEIVSCRRVMERSVTDKWTTRNEKGDIVDEWSTRSWKGESDGLRRRGNGTGEAWHREVDVSPHGKTSFIDNRRFYTQNYVIESEARNA